VTPVVLDANVTVSGLLYGGVAQQVVEAVRTGTCTAYASPIMLQELERVLSYPRLARRVTQLGATPAGLVADWTRVVLLVPEAASPIACRDPADEPYLAVAHAVGAQLLVTGDRDLLTIGRIGETRIVDPAGCLAWLAEHGRRRPGHLHRGEDD